MLSMEEFGLPLDKSTPVGYPISSGQAWNCTHILFLNLLLLEGACECHAWHICGGQSPALWGRLPPSTFPWVLGIRVKSNSDHQAWMADTITPCWPTVPSWALSLFAYGCLSPSLATRWIEGTREEEEYCCALLDRYLLGFVKNWRDSSVGKRLLPKLWRSHFGSPAPVRMLLPCLRKWSGESVR